MKFFFTALLVFLQVAVTAKADILVEDAWVRGLPPGVANTSAYMTIRNTGENAVELTGASTDVAGMTMLHNTVSHEGMMHMEHVESISIAPHGELLLQSGGLHLMLMNLKTMPAPGAEVSLTLEFADGANAVFLIPVRSVLDE